MLPEASDRRRSRRDHASIQTRCYVGRAAELARLQGVGDAVLRGGRHVVLISGDAGVGKSRTVAEIVAWLRARQCRVLMGRCVEFGEQIWPFAALRELLACLVDDLDDEQLEFAFGSSAALFHSMVPELGGADTVTAPSIDPDRLCEAVVAVLRRSSQWGPLAVVMEDLHWADTSTLNLFALLARSTRPNSLLLLGTHRDDEPSMPAELRTVLADVARAARPDIVELQPFDRNETAAFVHALSNGTFDDAAVDTIHRLSGGNPFYAEELVAAGGSVDSSATLRHVVLARAARCSDEARRVLDMVAVGGRLPAELLRSTSATGLHTALGTGLVVIDRGDVRYRHELARTVVDAELSDTRRMELHAAVAATLASGGSDRFGEIARHWSEAGCAEPALAAWVAAGRASMRAGMPREASAQLQFALDLWSHVAESAEVAGCDHADLLVDAANAAYQGRQLDEAIRLTRQAIEELSGVDPWREGRCWLALRNMYRFSNRWSECADAVTHALDVIPPSPPSLERVEALADAALGHGYADEPQQAHERAEEALRLAEQVGTPIALVTARYAVASARANIGVDLEELVRYELETYAMCDESMSPERRLFALNSLTNTLVWLSRLTELIDSAATGVHLVRSTGLGGPLGAAMAEYWVGSLVTLGRWEEADHVYDDVADLIEQARDNQPFHHYDVALIRQGRLEEARRHIERVRQQLETPDFWDEILEELAAVVLEFDLQDGRDVDVVALVVDVHAKASRGTRFGEWSLLATAIGALADRPRDEAPVELVRLWLAEADGRGPVLPGEPALLRTRTYLEADRLSGSARPAEWRELAIGFGELGFRYDEAYAWFWAGEAMLAGVTGRGSASKHEAQTALRRAYEITARLGAAPLARQIEALAQSARVDLQADPRPAPQPARSDRLGLTAREADVLDLVAAGLSNGAIGERLFISRKTASVHVSNILRKLGVSNRIEAAGILHRISLDGDGAASSGRFDP